MNERVSPRLLSIKLIVLLNVLIVVGYGLNLFGMVVGIIDPVDVVLGFFLSGKLAILTGFFYMLLRLYLGYGLWRLKEVTRRTALGLEVYELFVLLLHTFIPSLRAKNVELVAQAGLELSQAGPFVVMTFLATIVLNIIVIWFLVTRKSAFRSG